MRIDWLLAKFEENKNEEAIIWNGESYTYQWLLDAQNRWSLTLSEHRVGEGAVVAVEADYSPNSCALMLALIENRCVFVPLTQSVRNHSREFIEISEASFVISLTGNDYLIRKTGVENTHSIYSQLADRSAAGLVLFSSGSTGKSKAAVHDFSRLLEKFRVPRKSKRMLAFLLFDHIGGINTLFYSLANAGTVITVQGRSPDEICSVVDRHRVQVLPTSPTFLNLLLISESHLKYDLSSLELVTYGTEVMPESTLARIRQILPAVNFQQTYGLSELGILRSKSRSSDSLWVKIGGEGFETRIVDGVLWIKAESAMLGYLNAPNPFDEEGWFNTQDEVLVDGDYMRILGRKSEIINVGGEKVYPAEVESVLMQMDNVIDAVVMGEKHPLVGNIVVAKLNLIRHEDNAELRQKIRDFCKDKLPSYKVPVKVFVTTEPNFSERFKKMRR